MQIIYKDNDATKVPLYMSGKRIEIRNWLINHSYDGFMKGVLAHSSNKMTREEIDELTKEKRVEEAEQADRDYLQEEF